MELTLHLNDKLKLYSRTFLATHHYEILYLLYQPLVGTEAVSLYFTLWSLFNTQKGDIIISHRQLVTFFNWNLTKLVEVRRKIEALDLLNVYYNTELGIYLYELRQPLSAKQYFFGSNLNTHLLYRVGDKIYEFLEKRFITYSPDKEAVNITASFTDVFSVIEQFNNHEHEKEYVSGTVNQFELPLNYDFDFELLTHLVSRQFVDIDKMAPEVKAAIIKEAALYRFDPETMGRIILECSENGEINLIRLHELSGIYYKRFKNKPGYLDIKPAMTEKEFSLSHGKKRMSKKERALKYYKTKTPTEYLSFLQGNTSVPGSMIEIINELYNAYKLPGEVINVLIEFIRVRNDGRLPREYTKTVASSWVFNKIKTAEEAMELVEKIQNKEMEYMSKGEVAPTYRYNKPRRVETEPKWMKSHKEYQKNRLSSEEKVDITELKELLDSFKEGE